MLKDRTIDELKRNAYELNDKLNLLYNDDIEMLEGQTDLYQSSYYSMLRMMRKVVISYIREINERVDPDIDWLSELTVSQLCASWKGEQQ